MTDSQRTKVSEAERKRRERAARLMGDVLPSEASDDRPEVWGERPAPTHDEELLRDVPPHHG